MRNAILKFLGWMLALTVVFNAACLVAVIYASTALNLVPNPTYRAAELMEGDKKAMMAPDYPLATAKEKYIHSCEAFQKLGGSFVHLLTQTKVALFAIAVVSLTNVIIFLMSFSRLRTFIKAAVNNDVIRQTGRNRNVDLPP
ncbi:MAG: hypothetical protein ABI443_05395 [Chthoniobacterales bacterium]